MWVWPNHTTQETELGATEWQQAVVHSGLGERPFHNRRPGCFSPGEGEGPPHDGCHCPGLRLTPCHVRHHTARQRRPHMWLVALQGFYGSWDLCTNGKHMSRLLGCCGLPTKKDLAWESCGMAVPGPPLLSAGARSLCHALGVLQPERLGASCCRALARTGSPATPFEPFLRQDLERFERQGLSIYLLLRSLSGMGHRECGFFYLS